MGCDLRRTTRSGALESLVRRRAPTHPRASIRRARVFALRALAQIAQMPEPDELVGALVPQTQSERPQARHQSQRLHLLEQRIGAVTSLEVVVGDARAEVV